MSRDWLPWGMFGAILCRGCVGYRRTISTAKPSGYAINLLRAQPLLKELLTKFGGNDKDREAP